MHTETAMIRGRVFSAWTRSLHVRPIQPDERETWRTLMATHHYLGFRGLVGKSLYYVACVENEWVALLGWAAAPWMCRPTVEEAIAAVSCEDFSPSGHHDRSGSWARGKAGRADHDGAQ